MSFSHFKDGNFKSCIAELEKICQEKHEESDNLEVAKYYQSGCKDTADLLSKLERIDPNPFTCYNQAVLLYYKEHYGSAIKLLSKIVSPTDVICEYLPLKGCILLIECYLALDMLSEARSEIEKLEQPEFIELTKESPQNQYFGCLVLGAWSEEKCNEEVSAIELKFVTNILKCRFYLKQGESENAKTCLVTAENLWQRINPNHYDPVLFKHLYTQQVVIKNYLSAQIAYTEGNMNATLQKLNQAQIEVLPLLVEKQSHPSCIPSREKLSHPIYHYSNLGCVHLRLGKPRLSRFYFSKALETLKPHTPVDVSKPLCTVTYHSSQRRADLLYNSALSLLASGKPKHALDCLQEICPIMQNKSLFWYRIAECYVMIHLKNLAAGRRDMISDVCQSQIGKKYYLPSKVNYTFKEEEDKENDNPLEQAAMCLRNALSLCKDEEMKINFLLLLCYVCMNTQPQCAVSAAQQLLHMEVTDSQRFIASMYASEALLILGKPRQAIEYVSHVPKEMKLKCHSTISPIGAVITEEVSSKFIQSINLSSAHLHSGNIPHAQQALTMALNYHNLSFQPANLPSLPVPAAVLNIAIYIALKMGNHSQAESFVRSRQVYAGMQFNKATEIRNMKFAVEKRIKPNLWDDLSRVPDSRLRHVLPGDVRKMDLEAFNLIKAKAAEEQKTRDTVEDLRQVNRLRDRLGNIQRHAYFMKLEKKSGIEKVRNLRYEQGVYGYVKSYRPSDRIIALSTPHRFCLNELDRSDFKGLISKEYPEIVSCVKDRKANSLSIRYKNNEKRTAEDPIRLIKEFELKLQTLNSS